MKASELRIGNTIRYTHDTDLNDKLRGTFLTIDIDTLTYLEIGDRPDFYEPIPLTPAILEKCGFVRDRNGFALSDKMSLSLSVTKDGEYLACWLDKSLGITVENVHQLQNLYFALTGEELTVNL
jgi:hypothetical protein